MPAKILTVLGIESSCDETAVALVNSQKQILAQQVFSQLSEHAAYGGVVPEIAARSHLQQLPILLKTALEQANYALADVDAIAATAGPGLVGGLIVGLMTAKTMAAALNKPFIAVNHLEAHALTARLTNEATFPYLLLLVSGGHCQLLVAHGVGNYHHLGGTIDDAVGEAFDKVAKMLGLGYPGGPIVEKLAQSGDPHKYPLPRPLLDSGDCRFSFSGLKTAVKRLFERQSSPTMQDKADICASFQHVVAEILLAKVACAIKLTSKLAIKQLVIAGGVAANRYLFSALQNKFGADFAIIAPPLALCTDNAAMVAWAGIERLQLGKQDSLDFEPKPRWPLNTIA